MVSKHYNTERNDRERFIKKCFNDDGHIIDEFVVDKGHPKGAEIHSITDKGIIIVHNLNSGVLVTKLIARPQQIKRYYESTGRKRPTEYQQILELARLHESLGFNNM